MAKSSGSSQRHGRHNKKSMGDKSSLLTKNKWDPFH